MGDLVLVDNDVILKASCYRLAHKFRDLFLPKEGRGVAGLGLARFVLTRKVKKSPQIANRAAASAELDEMLRFLDVIEPDTVELGLAARYEAHAQATGYALDSGESQLLAVLVRRSANSLVTGDKRAVIAIGKLASDLGMQAAVDDRLICLEQVMLALSGDGGMAEIATLVCAEVLVDKTMSICFRCSSGQFDEKSTRTGLESYIEDLRRHSGAVLAAAFPT